MSVVKNVVKIASLAELNSKTKTKTVFMDFFATWCQPCKMISPVFSNFAEKNDKVNVEFVSVDVDQNQDIAQQYAIRAMPTFVVAKNGKEVDRFEGASPQLLEQMIKRHG
eukprot:snap_masked-scaffold_18-processed-gene-1.32-mRNA-1 protein AED:0.39 eAED:0.39 QI:0/-1/0/1/-1/1/1/0/109